MTAGSYVNRINTTREVKPVIAGWYEELRTAHADGKFLAWTYGPVPFEIFRAMDIRFEHLESYGAYLAARAGQEKLKQLSESDGYSNDICSYARLVRGVAMLNERGDKSSVPGVLLVESPDFVVAFRQCPLMATVYDYQKRLFNVPGFCIDTIPAHSEADYRENLNYIRRQLEELVVFLEDLTKTRLDFDRLKQIMAHVKEAAIVRNRVLDLCKSRPAPMTVFDHFISLGPSHSQRGKKESVEYWKRLETEVQERVNRGIGAIHDEKFRLYWHNLPIWFKVGRLSEVLARQGAVLVAASYTHELFYSHEPEKINPEDPLTSIATEEAWQSWLAADTLRTVEQVQKEIEDYAIDGMIMCSHRTCQPADICEYDMIDIINRKLGVPGIVIDADPTDPAFYSDAQTETRLQAFIETLEAHKKRASAG
jgi:benzoyl-CoA reductase/2-hydroxyglutaryl-CoA dehydratase subunit BcrC/BadD/HgdB